MKISAIISAIEAYAKPSLQEKWDNTGLQVGSPFAECTGVLTCLDVTPAVVEEAISLGCNLIISHHPLFFKPVKKLTGSTPNEACAINAIAAGISIYSSHTAADSTKGGVSYELARKLGITPKKVLSPLADRLVRLQVEVPKSHAETLRLALFDAGAGAIGNYDCCSFNVSGQGTYRPLDGAQPYDGTIGIDEAHDEVSIQAVVSADDLRRVEQTIHEVHPYETPAYSFTPMLNTLSDCGLGIYGIIEAEDAPTAAEFVEHVKEALGCQAVRTTKVDLGADARIRRVAVCGGAGAEFIPTVIAMGAQAYVTADVKYHAFVDYRDQLLIIDAGHYDTEAPIKEIFRDVVRKAFPAVSVYATATDDNPVRVI